MPRFEKLRVSLQREEPGALLAGHEEAFRSRSEFLVAAFSSERAFLHRGGNVSMTFTPLEMPEGYVGGFFKRERPAHLKKADLSPYDAENYESALALVTTRKEQFAWVEANPRVGSTRVLLESYFDFLMRKTDVSDWRAYVRYIDADQVYWEVIKRRKREIAKLSFSFIPPNALDSDDRIYDLIKDISNEARPDTQQHVYRAQAGQMDPESPLMKSSAKIAMDGGGEAEVRDQKNKIIFSSGQARVNEDVPDDDMPTADHPTFVRRVITRLFER